MHLVQSLLHFLKVFEKASRVTITLILLSYTKNRVIWCLGVCFIGLCSIWAIHPTLSSDYSKMLPRKKGDYYRMNYCACGNRDVSSLRLLERQTKNSFSWARLADVTLSASSVATFSNDLAVRFADCTNTTNPTCPSLLSRPRCYVWIDETDETKIKLTYVKWKKY